MSAAFLSIEAYNKSIGSFLPSTGSILSTGADLPPTAFMELRLSFCYPILTLLVVPLLGTFMAEEVVVVPLLGAFMA